MTTPLTFAQKAAQVAQIGTKDPRRFPTWPEVKQFFRLNKSEDKMYANVLCYPSLGQATVVESGKDSIRFHVVLEVSPESVKEWEVEIWAGYGTEWSGFHMEMIDSNAAEGLLSINEVKGDVRKLYFTTDLQRPKTGTETKFTIRFRSGQDWKWVNDQFSVCDGSIYWQPHAFPTTALDTRSIPEHDLSHWITGTDPRIKSSRRRAQTSDTLLWELSCHVDAAKGEHSSWANYNLGLATNFTRWFATCRLMTVWLLPKHGKAKFFNDDTNAVTIAFLRHDGYSVVLLALSGIDDTHVHFRNDLSGKVVINVRNDAATDANGRVLVAVAKSFDVANAAVIYHARELSLDAQEEKVGEEQKSAVKKLEDVEPQWLEEWYDGFGYCTWNSLGQQLTQDKILDALRQFRDDGINVSTLIIDDNWQSLDNEGQNQGRRGMTRFEADAKAFPDGLRQLILKVKEDNPTITRVAVWHTMLGYWGAISPDGELAKNYRTIKALNNNGWDWTCIAPEDISRFYDDLFKFLASCGVDGVKTDSQNSLDDLQNATHRSTMIKPYQDAWTLAGLRHIHARQIGCGSQVPAIMFHSMIKTHLPRIVVRNSDDFFPHNPGSHPWHIFANAHNMHVMRHLNILPDWDMFQTDHEWAGYHAAARCISGGPVYITDAPGRHDKGLIRQMVAKSRQGKSVVLRPSRLAKSSEVYTSYAEPKLLKVDAYNGSSGTGTALLGVFNVNQTALREVISLPEFPGTDTGKYIIRSFTNRRTSTIMEQGSPLSFVQIDLEVKGYDILTAYPISSLSLPSGRDLKVANLGLIDKMSGAAGIVATQIFSDNRGHVWSSLKALGVWGVWVDCMPEISLQEDCIAMVDGKAVAGKYVKVSETDPRVVEIDVEGVWDDEGEKGGWSNEIRAEFMILR